MVGMAGIYSESFDPLERYLPDQRVGHPAHDAGVCAATTQRGGGAHMAVADLFFPARGRDRLWLVGTDLFAEEPAGTTAAGIGENPSGAGSNDRDVPGATGSVVEPFAAGGTGGPARRFQAAQRQSG